QYIIIVETTEYTLTLHFGVGIEIERQENDTDSDPDADRKTERHMLEFTFSEFLINSRKRFKRRCRQGFVKFKFQ
ncbi:MAG TPA: hypothetical protein VEJ88_05760, partial [Dissulfurispiraceae bacterium]|nr:hypothetical protein [Dissulfurispiraceae bacterium]